MDDILCPKCGGATPTQEAGEGIPPAAECSFCGFVYWPSGDVDVEEYVKGRTGVLPARPSWLLPGSLVRVVDGTTEALEGRHGLVESVSGQFCRVVFVDPANTVWVPCHWLESND